MATIKAFIRVSTKNTERANIRFRLTDGRNIQLFYKSELEIEPKVWDEKTQSIKAKVVYDSTKRLLFNKSVSELKQVILDAYNEADKEALTSETFCTIVDKRLHPDKYLKPSNDFFSTMSEFLQKRKLSEVREKNFMVLYRALKRYEMFVSINQKKVFMLDIDTINSDTIEDFESFLRNEHTLCMEYPQLYEGFPANVSKLRKTKMPVQRGDNTICSIFNRLRAFINWCNEQGKTTNKPFANYEGVTTEKYGTPFYITIDERNQIADFDLSNRPQLAIQRDIFVFQCLIGCRVSDLLKMTEANVMRGAVEYIPQKTKEDNPIIVRVPLNGRAQALLEKYKGVDSKKRLFPFISDVKYNKAIKDIFWLCGITRIVTILNPTNGQEEKRPINEVASSHMARRTFVGNLYKKVKDPNLVGSLSGHKEGSKAFARYREIDDDIKKELVNMIE